MSQSGNLRIAVLGAGVSGICMGVQLKQAGFHNFTIFEKADRVGGTWRENTYPGVSCDVPSHLYSFSFKRNPDWPRQYSGGADIQAYCEDVSRHFKLAPHIAFNRPVSEARYEKNGWQLTFADGSQDYFDVVVSALGGLHNPSFPDIKGMDSFAGETFHTANWNHDIDLTDKKVVMIGNAASAVQAIPQIADKVASLDVFQRTPNWLLNRSNSEFSGLKKWLMRKIPLLSLLERWRIYLWAELIFHPAFRQNSFMQKALRRRSLNYIRNHVQDPALLEKLIPDYPLGCKRVLFVDGYLEALQKPQVSLVTDAIDHITAQGVVDAKGSLHAADVLIYATGFMPFNFLNYFSVTGPGGVQLADHWAEKVQSHRTLAVSGFPNFFMLLGPNSGLGHNSVILMIEAQVGYIVKCLQQMTRRNMPYLDPKPENQQAFNQTIQARLTGSVWDGSCSSWYKSDVGQNYTIWPFSATRYILEMRNPDFSEFNDGSNTSDQLDAAE